MVYSGPVRYRLRSEHIFGDRGSDQRSNTTYEIFHDIFPHTVRATMTKGNADGFACIVELTPGGDDYESSDYVTRPSGAKGSFNGDLSPEWVYLGDANDPNKFFFIHVEDDNVNDAAQPYGGIKMIMAGWGRSADPGIRTYPSTFYFGFDRAPDHVGMTKVINSIHHPLTIEIKPTQAASSVGSYQVKNSPRGFALHSILPNPARAAAAIGFSLPFPGLAQIGIYNIQGKSIDQIDFYASAAGMQSLTWRAKTRLGHSISPGFYICFLKWQGKIAKKVFILTG